MPIPQELLDKAEEMARAGKPISKIVKALQVDYDELWQYLKSIEAYSWQGAKSIVTRRLKSLATEGNQRRREELAGEAKHMADYLYDHGVAQARKIEKVKKALE